MRVPALGTGLVAALVSVLVTGLLTGLVTGLLPVLPAGASSAATVRPIPTYLSLAPGVRQLLTVTSARWSDTRAELRAWRKVNGRWTLVHGPVQVRLGYAGWAPARTRVQSSGTTPAGRFRLPFVFGNRADPGSHLDYRRVDSTDVWPYEPRDPATYNIYQPFRAATSHWRTGYFEHLAHYPYEYAYSVVIGFNLPTGVHWSSARRQYVASTVADTRRGGGIFLHVQQTRYTAGCVAGPIDDIRWVVRWLRPGLDPRIVMGPRDWVERTF